MAASVAAAQAIDYEVPIPDLAATAVLVMLAAVFPSVWPDGACAKLSAVLAFGAVGVPSAGVVAVLISVVSPALVCGSNFSLRTVGRASPQDYQARRSTDDLLARRFSPCRSSSFVSALHFDLAF